MISSNGAGTPGSMLDPDGIAVDSADNVFRVTLGGVGTVTDDAMGDGLGSPMDNPTSHCRRRRRHRGQQRREQRHTSDLSGLL